MYLKYEKIDMNHSSSSKKKKIVKNVSVMLVC